MYSECIRCQKLGSACDGPNFVAMEPQVLLAWCKERKKHLGLTNARLAELSGMSQGTIDSLLANTHADFKFGTIRPLLQVLVGGKWLGDPCPDPTNAAAAEMKEKIRQHEAEIAWRDDKIRHYMEEYNAMKAQIADANERHQVSQDFLQEQLRGKNRTIHTLAVLLGIALSVIIGALVVDKLNPNIGFFWLDGVASLFNALPRPIT